MVNTVPLTHRDSGKKKGKRHHSHHSRHDDSDSEEDSSSMSSDYDSDTSSSSVSSDTSTSEEERRRRARKKARRASEGKERRRSKTKQKPKKRASGKGKMKKEKQIRKIEIGTLCFHGIHGILQYRESIHCSLTPLKLHNLSSTVYSTVLHNPLSSPCLLTSIVLHKTCPAMQGKYLTGPGI